MYPQEAIETLDAPHSLMMILEPDEALQAAQRLQHRYQSSPYASASSVFGRDGRRVTTRPSADSDAYDAD
jgi:hypothetical protein